MTTDAMNLERDNPNRREPHGVCPGCHGTGDGRGIEAGMGCGFCHGHGTVTAEFAAWLRKHPRFGRTL